VAEVVLVRSIRAEPVEEASVGQIVREQVDVSRERERGRVVAEPELHLLRVQPRRPI
jgi:hypothetical protein